MSIARDGSRLRIQPFTATWHPAPWPRFEVQGFFLDGRSAMQRRRLTDARHGRVAKALILRRCRFNFLGIPSAAPHCLSEHTQRNWHKWSIAELL